MDENKTVFADGIFFTRRAVLVEKRPKLPEFIKGSLSFKVDEAVAFLKQHKNEAGYVNLDLKEAKSGKWYLSLNSFSAKKEDKSEDIGF